MSNDPVGLIGAELLAQRHPFQFQARHIVACWVPC